jgi:hypothetical protein
MNLDKNKPVELPPLRLFVVTRDDHNDVSVEAHAIGFTEGVLTFFKIRLMTLDNTTEALTQTVAAFKDWDSVVEVEIEKGFTSAKMGN